MPSTAHRKRRRRILFATAVAAPLGLGLWGWTTMIHMPGKSFVGPLPPLTDEQAALQDVLRRDIETLATDIGERNTHNYEQLQAAADFIEESLQRAGHEVRRQGYDIDGRPYDNVEAQVPGHGDPEQIVVIGAHYDSAIGTPGANDNASGVAALLELARRFSSSTPSRTLRLVAFTNEEMPHFRNGTMGSAHYAQRAHERGEDIVAMFSLETIGYYSTRPGSQRYPFPMGVFYPDRGNFIGFIGNVASRSLVKRSIASFRRHARFPSEGAALPSWVPGVGWSDHASFWDREYRAVMVTDTAPFRYPYYHRPGDTPDKIDYPRLARVVDGLGPVVRDLVDGPSSRY